MVESVPTRGRVAAWSCYLGSSWTWVIGMLFPILLVRDFGLWGWIVFAVPNVLGAMAMGFVIDSPKRADDVLREHKVMFGVFSNFTFVFHVLVLCWVSAALLGWISVVIILLLVPIARLLNLRSSGKTKRILIASVAVTVVSWILLGYCATLPGAWSGVSFSGPTRLGTEDLLLFVPASVMGFVLCPYLDRTFFQTRRALPGHAGKWAFGLGFGVVFLSMIVFALMYSGVARPIFEFMMRNRIDDAIPPIWLWPLAGFVFIQAVFTMTLHEDHGEPAPPRREVVGVILIAGLALLGVLLLRYDIWPVALMGGLTPFEVGYRVFLLAYGVVFPGYVWLCMLPLRGRRIELEWRVWVWVAAMVLVLPMGYACFVMAWPWWLLGILTVLLVARVIISDISEPVSSEGIE